LLLIGHCTSVARVPQAMGLIIFNELKIEKKIGACVDRILKTSITPFAHFLDQFIKIS